MASADCPLVDLLRQQRSYESNDGGVVGEDADNIGADEAVGMLRDLQGRPLRSPLPGHEAVRAEFIRRRR